MAVAGCGQQEEHQGLNRMQCTLIVSCCKVLEHMKVSLVSMLDQLRVLSEEVKQKLL